MSRGGRHEKILAKIYALEDQSLVQIAWDEFDQFERSSGADPSVIEDVRRNLVWAEAQLDHQVVLSKEARGRMRSFLYNRSIY